MERIWRHLSYANVAATLALVLAMCGGAIAATGGLSSGAKLQACVNGEGAIRLLKSGKHCKRGQKTVSWNQTGPQGSPGAKGATGATGATGPIGLTGASGQPSNVMWGQIEEDGILEAGHGVTGVTNVKSPYTVTFERDITHCAVVATMNTNGIVSNVVTNVTTGLGNKAEVWILNHELSSAVSADFSIIAVC
jgi:hypothetical protein